MVGIVIFIFLINSIIPVRCNDNTSDSFGYEPHMRSDKRLTLEQSGSHLANQTLLLHSRTHSTYQSDNLSCNLTTALRTTYYAKFNYSGPIAAGLTCYVVYECEDNIKSISPICDSFVYYLLYMEAYEIVIRVQKNYNNCANSKPSTIWSPNSGIFNYKEIIIDRDGHLTIKQRQRSKKFSELTKDLLIDTDYATENRFYPREKLRKWSKDIYVYNKTEYGINGEEYTERDQCVKIGCTWKCDSDWQPNEDVADSISWSMEFFDQLSGFYRIQFFIENNVINRTGYHGMDGEGWNVTDTVIATDLAGPDWRKVATERILFFDKLWVEGCRCANKLQPGENLVTKCEHWNLMKRNFKIPFKPAGLAYCPNMDHLKIPSDAFHKVT